MLDVFSEIIGITIAGGIIYAAKEIKRTADCIRDLDTRVARLEHWLHGEGVPVARRRARDTEHPPERSGDREG